MLDFQTKTKNFQDKNTHWLLNYGVGVLRMNLSKSFELRASTKSMQLLMFFNSGTSMHLGEYIQRTQYDLEVLKKSIWALIKTSILLPNVEVNNPSQITPKLELSLNLDYAPKGELVEVMEDREEEGLSLAVKEELT